MQRSQLQLTLGSVMLTVALAAVVMALLVHFGDTGLILAFIVLQMVIVGTVYGKMWVDCQKEGRTPARADEIVADRAYRRLFLVFLAPLGIIMCIWIFFLKRS